MTDETSPSITAQGDRSVAVGRDVINSIINTGDHNQFFVGDYERLRDAYLEPWPVFERVDLGHFVGREWLLAELDAFLGEHDRGYFILEAAAGLGKTTFLAWLVRERGYIHHFVELAPGLEGVGRGLKNLAAQLVLAYHLDAYEAEGVLPGAAARADYLSKLLKQAVEQRRPGEKVVLIVDALDEAGTPPQQNVLGLPQVLPAGVFVVVSQRPVAVTLHVDTVTTPRYLCRLAADRPENQADMRRFLERAAAWPGVSRALRQSGYTPEQFTATLLDRCQGVWIYLHFVLHEIECGERSPLDLAALPGGITQYYASYWQRWRDEDEARWDSLYLPLLTTLAAAQEAISGPRLAEWAGVLVSELGLRRLLAERWRPFLALAGQGEQTRYRFYHATLREFFAGQVKRTDLTSADAALLDELAAATRAAHERLVERYLQAWGGLAQSLPGLQIAAQRDLDDGYGLRHLAAHLVEAGRAEELDRLLEMEWVRFEAIPDRQRGKGGAGRRKGGPRVQQRRHCQNAWHLAREAVGETTGYLADLARAWRLAEEDFASRRAPSAIGLQCRYALMIASVNSLAQNLPPALLVALVERGLWPPSQGLAYARQVPDPKPRAEALAGLTPHLPPELLAEALAAARKIEDGDARAQVLAGLAPHLPPELLAEALAAVRKIEDGSVRARTLAELAPHLPSSKQEAVLAEALAAARAIWQEVDRVEALAELAPHLPPEMLAEALAAARAIEDGDARGRALVWLAPHLPSERLAETLASARKIEDGDVRAETLAGLASYLPPELLAETLATARKIEGGDLRAWALTELAPHLPTSEREAVLAEALAAARKIGDEDARAWALAELVPHLSASEREAVLAEALAAAREIEDEYPRAETLAGLASHLPPELLAKALAAARKIEEGDIRVGVLADLAPYLPSSKQEAVLAEALAAARVIEGEGGEDEMGDSIGDRAQALAELAPYLAQISLAALYPLWGETLPELARQTRHDLLADLRELVPVIVALGGAEAAAETCRAIQDVGRWWP